MRVIIKKKNILIFGILILVPVTLLQVSCSSNTILTENLELTLPEQKQMLSSIKRKNDNFYVSNLKNYSPPKENQLIDEAQFRNLKLFNESARVLSDWVLRNLSQKERIQMSRNWYTLLLLLGFPCSKQSTCAT